MFKKKENINNTKKGFNMKCNNTEKKETAMKTELPDMETLDNLTDMIPEDERADIEASSQEEQKMVVVETLMPNDDVTSEIPEEERGTTEEEVSVEMTEASKCGCFYPTLGMTGFVTNTKHKIHARIYIDSKGNRLIEYCQQYNDGSYSAKMKIKQADLLIAASYSFDPQKAKNTQLKNQINNFIIEVSKDYFNKIVFPNEAMDVSQILNLIMHQYNSIHIESETAMSKLDQPDKLYPAIIGLIKKNGFDKINEHDAYYTLCKEHMETLAEDLDVSLLQLLKKLKEYHFLYLTESSNGYQTCVRFKAVGEFFPKPYTQWCYCILNLEYLAKRKMQKALGQQSE